jgi:tetratricopeptide (TPR) repeat protein
VSAAVALAVLGLALAAASAVAQPEHDAAVRDLGSADVEHRRDAARALGTVGRMADSALLVAALRDADAIVRKLAERALLMVWARSGDAAIDEEFATGLEQMNEQEAPVAVETFTRIIQRKPEFAEAWNKRATVYYYLGEYDKSLADCDEVMKRNPYHFGALAGYGMIYLQLGQPERALSYFERALDVNPNLEQVEATVRLLRERLGRRKPPTT